MMGFPLMEGFVADRFTEGLSFRIRVVLDGVWAGSGDLLKNGSSSSSSELVHLSEHTSY